VWETDGTGTIFFRDSEDKVTEMLRSKEEVAEKLNELLNAVEVVERNLNRATTQLVDLRRDYSALEVKLQNSQVAERDLIRMNSDLVAKVADMTAALKGHRLVDCLPFDIHPDVGVEILLWERHGKTIGTYNVIDVGEILVRVKERGNGGTQGEKRANPRSAARGRGGDELISDSPSSLGQVQGE
jgi:hypothetical protein